MILRLRRSLFGPVIALATVFGMSGCASDASFAAFSDEQLHGVLPTEAEVAAAIPGQVALQSPRVSTKSAATPDAPNADLPSDVPESCRDAFLGTEETRSLTASTVRRLERRGSAGEKYEHQLLWRLIQLPSESDAKHFVEVYRGLYQKCELYSLTDLDVDSGFGRSVVRESQFVGSFGIIAVGDITISVAVTDFSKDEGMKIVSAMSRAMERRLKASAPD